MTDQLEKPVNEVVIHMYKMGTGDCFVLKFMADNEVTFKMLIDCGCWNRKYAKIRPFIQQLKKDVDNHLNALVVTHEHTDHVLGFQAGKQIFTSGFQIDEVWMSWSENEVDEKVKRWKTEYGEKKKALAYAAERLNTTVKGKRFKSQLEETLQGDEMVTFRENFAKVMNDFAYLNANEDQEYKGSLKGMAVVKKEIAKNNIRYRRRGDVLEKIPGLKGVRIYVLGPPEVWEEVREESGEQGSTYKHNKDIEESDLFIQALNGSDSNAQVESLCPFESEYITKKKEHRLPYTNLEDSWRRIDYDWLFSSGALALRINSLTNNLSLVLAFEFVESGKVILFPADAEIGSWMSWHEIDWQENGYNINTEDLLSQVVFYKVAHHLSHNGTARNIGLDMMTHPDLVAMATLDYDVISDGWKTTMPNRLLIRDLMDKTKGRTIIMNEKGLHYDIEGMIPLSDKIAEYRGKMTTAEKADFEQNFDDENSLYLEYTVSV